MGFGKEEVDSRNQIGSDRDKPTGVQPSKRGLIRKSHPYSCDYPGLLPYHTANPL